MNFKITSKQLKSGYGARFIWKTGYCDLQNLFTGVYPVAYTSGIYGWNYDAYDIGGVLITTGYRGMIGQEIPLEIERKYEQLAKELNAKKWDIKHDDRMQQLEVLRKQFIKELYANK